MTNTLTISRELAERLAVPMLRTPEYLFDHRDALDELRALLAAPDDGYRTCAAFGCKRGGHYHPLVKHCEFCGNPFDAAPVVERQPTGQWRISVNGDWFYGTHEQCVRERAEYESTFTDLDREEADVVVPEQIWSSPPAPVAVPHTMKSLMSAICAINGFPMLTSNQCHALAQSLNAIACLDKVKEMNR